MENKIMAKFIELHTNSIQTFVNVDKITCFENLDSTFWNSKVKTGINFEKDSNKIYVDETVKEILKLIKEVENDGN